MAIGCESRQRDKDERRDEEWLVLNPCCYYIHVRILPLPSLTVVNRK